MGTTTVIQSMGYFILAGLLEIGGGYLVWLWLREGKPFSYAALGAVILVLYGVIPTLQPTNFGRVSPAAFTAGEDFRNTGNGRIRGIRGT